MTSHVMDSEVASTSIVSVNMRTFVDIDIEKLKVKWVDMKDEPPMWHPDAANSGTPKN